MTRILPTTPQRTYLYRLFSADGTLLYVGISCHVQSRFGSHKSRNGLGSPWWNEVAFSRIQQYATRGSAERAEAVAIRDERPLYNKQLGTRHLIRAAA